MKKFILPLFFLAFPLYSYNFTVIQLSNGKWHQKKIVTEDLTGKYATVFVFFLPGIDSSLKILEDAQKVQKVLKNIKIYGVTKPQKKDLTKVMLNKLRRLNITLPIILDYRYRLASSYGVKTVPSVVVVARDLSPIIYNTDTFLSKLNNGSNVFEMLLKIDMGKKVCTLHGFSNLPAMAFEGVLMKDFTIPLYNGESFTLNQNLGKYLILYFWKINDKNCLNGLKILNNFARKHPDINIIAVLAVKNEKDRETGFTIWEKYGGNLKLGIDSGLNLLKKFRVNRLPTWFIINKFGKTVKVGINGIDNLEEDLKLTEE